MPEATCANKRVCVTGTIEDYRGAPEIASDDPRLAKEAQP
jgi:hypothetical protein